MSKTGGWRWIILVSQGSHVLNHSPIYFLCFQLSEGEMLPAISSMRNLVVVEEVETHAKNTKEELEVEVEKRQEWS